jgi:transposase
VRPPEVFVRALEPGEAQRLKRLATDAKHRCTRIRAMILLASATEMAASQIASLYLSDAEHVRKVVHEFNDRGFGSLDPNYRGGRPKKVTRQQRDEIVSVARARPDSQHVVLTRWSVDKLAQHLAEQQIAQLSPTALRALLDQAGLSFQRTRSWKWSPDPDFKAKAERVLGLYVDRHRNTRIHAQKQTAPGGSARTEPRTWMRTRSRQRRRGADRRTQGRRPPRR